MTDAPKYIKGGMGFYQGIQNPDDYMVNVQITKHSLD